MWRTLTFLLVLFLLIDDVHQNVNKRRRMFETSKGRKIQAVIEKNGVIINIHDRHKVRHHPWSSETERDMIKNIRCRRYNSGYYMTNRCTNYCNCPYYYNNYNCAPCSYNPAPTFDPQYTPSVIITCNCDLDGSLFNTCNSNGQCMCKPNYKGPKCKRCKAGFWKNQHQGCIDCQCDKNGADSLNCDIQTGKCSCKPGVGGNRCDACLRDYYGNIAEGCQKCEPCDKEGHICDPFNGKCVCPSLTVGYRCERCATNSWGYIPAVGCKNCSCSTSGSLKSQCEANSGKCECKKGYEGEKCNSCSVGFYGYPNCRPCTCDPNGTFETEFVNGAAKCNENGECKCKRNVGGKNCDKCRDGTFGLDKNNPNGCTECFCFGRSNKCSAVDYTWDQIHAENVSYSRENCLFSSPCINLPSKFNGDLTLSYGGFLRIISSIASQEFFVRITGNNVTIESSFNDEVKLDEINWRMYRTSDKLLPDCNRELNRMCLMVILQNVSNIAIKTSSLEGFSEVLLDKAVLIPSAKRSKTIEKCDCPIEYSSLSCQDPNTGYFRHRGDYSSSWVDRIVGIARKCDCNGLSDTCDPFEGYCTACRNFTSGPHCEYCADGYYKLKDDSCLPCLCPSEKQNFAKNCTANHKMNHFVCQCKEGYTGKKCNECSEGYFGKPKELGGFCEKCNCNPYGSVKGNCDKTTGHCQCHPGFTGIRCDQCKSPRKFINNGVCSPCDECTQILFNSIDELADQLNNTLVSFEDGIQGPWKYLDAIEDRYDLMKERAIKSEEHLGKFRQNFIEMNKHEDKTNNLYSSLKKHTNQLENQIEKIENLKIETVKINENITKLHEKLNKLIDEMNNFGTSHLDIKNSLEKAKHMLKEIDADAKKMRNLDENTIIIKFCEKIIAHLKEIYKYDEFNINELKENAENLKMRYEDITNLSEFVKKETDSVKIKNEKNLLKYHELNKTISILKSRYKTIMDDISYSVGKVKDATKFIQKINETLEELLNSDHKNLYELLEEKESEYNENAPEIDKKMKKVREHVQFLNKTLINLKKEINFTQEEWKKINAGESYENIVRGITEAEENTKEAREILQKVNGVIMPSTDNDPLLTQSSISFGISDRLKQRIINHMKKNDLRKRLDGVKYELDNLERDIYKNGKNNNNFNSLLHDLKERLSSSKPNMDEMKHIIETASDVSRNMTRIISEVNTLKYINEHNLTRPFHKYLNLTSKENVRKLNQQIYSKINEIERVNINANLYKIIDRKHDVLKKNFEHLDHLKSKILALKSNITFTTQRVNNLYLPISLLNCSRWYQMRNIGVLNSLRMKFNCTTCNLLNLSSGGQSINIRVVDGLFILKYNEFPVEVEVERDSVISVEIRRKQDFLIITVQDQIIEIPEKKLMHITENDLINVGFLEGPSKDNGGCMYELFFNDMNVGLWNFVKSIGKCTACETEARGNEQGKLNTLYTEGSYTIYNVSTLNPQQFSVMLNFRTFDENSLLFLAQEITNPCAFIALFLNNGELEFRVRHNDNSSILSIPVGKKFNDGNENNVNIALQYKNNRQNYDLTVNEHSLNKERKLARMNVFRIRQSKYFVGGVSPEFNKSCVPVNVTSFVGFLNHRSEKNLRAIASYNTFPQNVEELNFYRAWFLGNGYLNMNTTLKFKKRIFSLYFEIHSVSNTSYIMNIEKVGKLFTKNRKIIFELQNGGGIESDVVLNDILNTVNITVKEQESILEVNSETGRGYGLKLMKGDFITLNIGEDVTKEYAGLLGGISNIYVDNKNVNFKKSTVRDFKHVEIGRWRMSQRIPEESPTSLTITENPDNMQNTQGCFPASAHQIDPSAIKFGDKMPSYVFKKNSFWKKNFTLEMQFRTLYPNGLLLISKGSQHNPQYNILEIRKGQLKYSVRGKRKPMTIFFEARVDDGEWHTVIIEQQVVKKKRKLRIALDGDWQKIAKTPKSNVRNEFYLGCVPENFTAKDVNIQQFIGCIREFKINNFPQLNTKDLSDYMNLGSCFPKVERGAYFGGDAFAIYQRDFRVNQQFIFSFEFKTSEHNGIILSVSNSGNSPALSIELQSGGMVMTIDLGSGSTFSITNNLNSDYALCNNKWHNVTAIYSSVELTINIDGIVRSWVRYDTNTMIDEIEAPLYIGGLPDSAPSGTLKIRENFKGCLRNFKIGDVIMDWTDMEELTGISIDSCPVTD